MRVIGGEKQIERKLNDEMGIEMVHCMWVFEGWIHGELFFITEKF